MDLTKLSEAQFLCDGARTGDMDNPLAFELGLQAIEGLDHQHARDLGHGYALHQVSHQSGDFLLVRAGEVVGLYVGESLALHPEHRGRGLSTPLILAAVPHRPLPSKRILSSAGERALRKAWRVANGIEPNPWP